MTRTSHYVLLAGDRWLCASSCACGEVPPPTTGTHPNGSGMAPRERRAA